MHQRAALHFLSRRLNSPRIPRVMISAVVEWGPYPMQLSLPVPKIMELSAHCFGLDLAIYKGNLYVR